jgi:hypothetical protein
MLRSSFDKVGHSSALHRQEEFFHWLRTVVLRYVVLTRWSLLVIIEVLTVPIRWRLELRRLRVVILLGPRRRRSRSVVAVP